MKQLESSQRQVLINICKKLLKNKKIEDIIIFGSFVKGKDKVNDIDVGFVFDEIDDNLIKNAYGEFEKKDLKVHIIKTKFSNLFDEPELWQSFIHEGYSIKKDKDISKILKITSYFLFEYNLKNLDKIKKQTFSHALYGTGGRDSFLKAVKGDKIGRNSVVVPVNKSEEMRSFFDSWQVNYKVKRIWM